jgi:hypothetical protein
MFVCADCRKNNRSGDDCTVCLKVRARLEQMPGYSFDFNAYYAHILEQQIERERKLRKRHKEQDRQYAEYLAKRQKEIEDYEAAKRRYTKSYPLFSWGFNIETYPCFDDFTYSPELRRQLCEQVNIEYDLMPELDTIPDPYESWRIIRIATRR